jgi:DNA-binding NarL/FixJ family response regulator
MFKDEQIIQTMYEAGAEAFLNKTVSPAELLAAIYGRGAEAADKRIYSS